MDREALSKLMCVFSRDLLLFQKWSLLEEPGEGCLFISCSFLLLFCENVCYVVSFLFADSLEQPGFLLLDEGGFRRAVICGQISLHLRVVDVQHGGGF